VHDSFLDVLESFFNIVVNAVDERALLYDQLVELLVDVVELVDGPD
jgi:hypothetical protein